MGVGGRFINEHRFRGVTHATQHLNFFHLKTKPGTLTDVHKGSNKQKYWKNTYTTGKKNQKKLINPLLHVG